MIKMTRTTYNIKKSWKYNRFGRAHKIAAILYTKHQKILFILTKMETKTEKQKK